MIRSSNKSQEDMATQTQGKLSKMIWDHIFHICSKRENLLLNPVKTLKPKFTERKSRVQMVD